MKIKIKVSLWVISIVLAIGLTIRLLTGPTIDLFPGDWYRYIWPFSLLFISGYVVYWASTKLPSWINSFKRKNKESNKKQS